MDIPGLDRDPRGARRSCRPGGCWLEAGDGLRLGRELTPPPEIGENQRHEGKGS